MKKRAATVSVIIAVLLVSLLTVYLSGRRSMEVSVNTEGLAYVICNTGGLGPRRLEYSENRELLDELFGAVSGEWSYVRGENLSGVDGKRPLFRHAV